MLCTLSLLSVSVKWLAVKTASEMTYTVSGGALNSAQPQPLSLSFSVSLLYIGYLYLFILCCTLCTIK